MYLFTRKTALNTYTRLSPEWRKQLFVATLSLRPQTFVGGGGSGAAGKSLMVFFSSIISAHFSSSPKYTYLPLCAFSSKQTSLPAPQPSPMSPSQNVTQNILAYREYEGAPSKRPFAWGAE